jgi:hypothetical protein
VCNNPFAFRLVSDHVYDATAWLALRNTSRFVAIPPHKSTTRRGAVRSSFSRIIDVEGSAYVAAMSVWSLARGGRLAGVGGAFTVGHFGIGRSVCVLGIAVVPPRGVDALEKKLIWSGAM